MPNVLNNQGHFAVLLRGHGDGQVTPPWHPIEKSVVFLLKKTMKIYLNLLIVLMVSIITLGCNPHNKGLELTKTKIQPYETKTPIHVKDVSVKGIKAGKKFLITVRQMVSQGGLVTTVALGNSYLVDYYYTLKNDSAPFIKSALSDLFQIQNSSSKSAKLISNLRFSITNIGYLYNEVTIYLDTDLTLSNPDKNNFHQNYKIAINEEYFTGWFVYPKQTFLDKLFTKAVLELCKQIENDKNLTDFLPNKSAETAR